MSLVRFEKKSLKAKYDFPAVSVYVKQSRLVFNTASYEAFQELSKGEAVDYVQIYLDSENPDVFYLTPAKGDAPDARKLGKSSTKGRFLDGNRLLKTLGWGINKPTTIKMEKNKKGTMFRVAKSAIV